MVEKIYAILVLAEWLGLVWSFVGVAGLCLARLYFNCLPALSSLSSPRIIAHSLSTFRSLVVTLYIFLEYIYIFVIYDVHNFALLCVLIPISY